MGCDIHCYVEYRKKGATNWDGSPRGWSDFGGRINPGRNYIVFGRLAGVRGDGPVVAEPRGIPDDLAYAATEDFWLHINYLYPDDLGENEVAPGDAERWTHAATRGEFRPYTRTEYANGHPAGTVTIGEEHAGKPTHVQGPDWHTPSWVTPDEWEQAIGEHAYEEYYGILAALRSFEARECDARVVFWFDN